MTLWYRSCRALYRFWFRTYHTGRIRHRERLPATGGVIVAGNHASFLDPPFIGLACRREMFFFARDSLFRSPFANWLLRSWNVLPLKREGGDLGAMRTMLKMLGDGQGIVLFPEGTRTQDGNLQGARSGIGMIVLRADVPVVPVRIFGTHEAMPRGVSFPRPRRITIVFGEPFRYPLPADFDSLRGEPLKALYQAVGDEVMRRIATLSEG